MYNNNNNNNKWKNNLVLTDTVDLVKRVSYKLDKNLFLYSKLTKLQKILIDDYQLITMNQFVDGIYTIENNPVVPVPKHSNNSLAYYEIKDKLPQNKTVKVINNDPLNEFLMNVNNCNNNNNNKYGNVLLNVSSRGCYDTLLMLPYLMKECYAAIKILDKNGNFYLNLNYYFYEPNVMLLQYILSFFDSVEYISNVMLSNENGNDMLKFSNYSGVNMVELNALNEENKNEENKNEENKNISHKLIIINNFYCETINTNKKVIKQLFDNDLDDNFVVYLNKIYKQQDEYFKMLLKKVNFINNKKIFRHINNQIDFAINWCEKHGVEINEIYKKNVVIKPNIIRKYFKTERGVDINKVKMTSDSLYSVTVPNIADDMSKIIKNNLPNINTIIDATANIGGNTLSFSSFFNKVIAVEINKDTFEILKNNVTTYNRKNVELINDDFLHLIDKLNADVIFMDPPWTGTFYKMYDKMDLFLSDVNIIDIIGKLHCKMVALKVPLNYNIVGLLDKVKEVQIFKFYNIMLLLIKK